MGLTVNHDTAALAAELTALKIELEEKLQEIDEQLLLLKETVFCVDPLDTDPVTWDEVRKKRDLLLINSDWTMITGATVDQREWSRYRQILRDLPQTYKGLSVDQIVWPVEPSVVGPNTTPVE
jgi:hypothetical protein